MRGETVRGTVLLVRYREVEEEFWVCVNAQPMRSPDGDLWGAIVVLRDISEIHRAKRALKRREELFRSLIENVQDVIFVLDAKGNVRLVSLAIETTLGYTPEELIGRNAFDLFHPEDLPRIRDIFRKRAERPSTAERDDFRLRHKDRSWRFFAGTGRNLLENPEVAGVVITARDVTERVRAEHQGLFHTSLLDNLQSAVIALDTEGRIIHWNNFTSQLCRWAPTEVLGKSILEVTIPLPRGDRYKEELKALQLTGHFEGEVLIQRCDGTTFPALLTVAAVRNRQRALIGYVGVAIDVTKRKEAEDQLKASREQLRQLAAHRQSMRETERARIARDIHDELGQQLTALRIDLFQLGKHLSGKAVAWKLVPNVVSAVGMVDSAIESVQRIAAQLRPSVLDNLGLAAAIDWQLKEFRSRTRIRCTIHGTEEDWSMDPERSIGCSGSFRKFLPMWRDMRMLAWLG
jgi:PAS domain S-box-containing protein